MNTQPHKSGLEGILFWLMLVSLGIFIGLFVFEILIFPWQPEQIAFFLGLGLFYLLANRLFFAYGQLSEFMDKVNKDEVLPEDVDKAYHRSGAFKTHLLEQLTHAGISMIWLERNEPYRYAYFGLYLVSVAFVLLSNMNALTGFTVGSILEGFFWGATMVSIFVFAAHLVVQWQFAQLVAQPLVQLATANQSAENAQHNADKPEQKSAETAKTAAEATSQDSNDQMASQSQS